MPYCFIILHITDVYFIDLLSLIIKCLFLCVFQRLAVEVTVPCAQGVRAGSSPTPGPAGGR